MKTQIGLYLDVNTCEELRSRAAATGAPISDLADLLLRFGLARIKDETIREWAAKQNSTRGRLAGGLTDAERRLIGAFGKLKAKEELAWRFPVTDLANAAGLKITPAFLALQRLRTRGMVEGMELEQLDRWGRPVKSFWCLASDRADHDARLAATRAQSIPTL